MNPHLVFRCVLSALSLLYALGLFLDYRRLPEVSVEDAPAPVPMTDAVVDNRAFELAGLIQLSEVIQRPLFVEGRRPISEKELSGSRNLAAKPKFKEKPFTVVVTGIVTAGDQKMAVLRNTISNQEHTLFLGSDLPDDYAEWVLDNINDREVVVTNKKSLNDSENNATNQGRQGSSDNDKKKQLPISDSGAHYTIVESAQ
ncbi:hypothetical protein SAMN04488073_3241 [Marinobacter gudaonensis]|uniref:Uncharacterized protein n=1 Tax=Marinobacter gudaonensis TaxID=375760 RepID=A0A1I6HZM9_9GAMM|nr:hypothetical protein [Marinobacter gudaonensis]SFR59922.1 hypothetical protein SAMN04488073_3241 [Marinobacter gudaonensis]